MSPLGTKAAPGKLDLPTLLRQVADIFASTNVSAPDVPVPMDETLTQRAADVYAKLQADKADPSVVDNIRHKYETDYGFTNGFRHGTRDSIHHPWNALAEDHVQAVLTAAAASGMRPEHLTALWITEGKAFWDQHLFYGQPATWPPAGIPDALNSPTTADSDQIDAAGRSFVLWGAFGTDKLAATTYLAAAGDSIPAPLGPSHASTFAGGLKALAELGAPGPISSQAGLDNLSRYLTDPGMAFSTQALVGRQRVDKVPAGSPVVLSVRIDPECVPTLLYLDALLFHVMYRHMAQDLLAAAYGDTVDLADRPWVTYVRWNAEKVFTPLLAGAGSSDEAIDAVFGEPPRKLTPEEIQAYDPPKSPGANGSGPIARSAHGTAVHFKFLCEVAGRWFEN